MMLCLLHLQEARAELTALLASLNPGNFAEQAMKRSDCGSFQEGGDLVSNPTP